MSAPDAPPPGPELDEQPRRWSGLLRSVVLPLALLAVILGGLWYWDSRGGGSSSNDAYGTVELPAGKNPTGKKPLAQEGRAAPDFILQQAAGDPVAGVSKCPEPNTPAATSETFRQAMVSINDALVGDSPLAKLGRTLVSLDHGAFTEFLKEVQSSGGDINDALVNLFRPVGTGAAASQPGGPLGFLYHQLRLALRAAGFTWKYEDYTGGNIAESVELSTPSPLMPDAPGGCTLRLSDLQGRPVLVNFWATWCPPCRREMPDLRDAAKAYASQGLVIVGIDLQEPDDMVQAFAEEFGITYPLVIDRDGELSDVWRLGGPVQGIPTSYFIDKTGVIRAFYYGPINDDALRDRLAKIGVTS